MNMKLVFIGGAVGLACSIPLIVKTAIDARKQSKETEDAMNKLIHSAFVEEQKRAESAFNEIVDDYNKKADAAMESFQKEAEQKRRVYTSEIKSREDFDKVMRDRNTVLVFDLADDLDDIRRFSDSLYSAP